MIRVLYFARLRDQLGTAGEDLPHTPEHVAALVAELRARGGDWDDALASDKRVLVAVNQEVAPPDTPLADGDEVALFPPVTGG